VRTEISASTGEDVREAVERALRDGAPPTGPLVLTVDG
jgi:hypothetical protein